jgi:DNA-binding transcriptional LysR family regulator
MTAFVRTVETGSLTQAARELETTQPTVSKRLTHLEKQIGTRLLQRNTQGISLTEAGERYYELCRRLLSEVEVVEAELRGLQCGLKGRLRLNMIVGLGEGFLTRLALRFQQQHPELKLEVALTDRVVDLVEDGVDVAIRMGKPASPDLIARHLGSVDYVMSATPGYLKAHPPLKRPEDILQHNFLRYGIDYEEVLFSPDGTKTTLHPDSNVILHSTGAVKVAILEGLGVGRTGRWLVDEDIRAGRLKEVLPGIAPWPLDVFAVYLPIRPQPQKVKAFVEYLSQAFLTIPGARLPRQE